MTGHWRTDLDLPLISFIVVRLELRLEPGQEGVAIHVLTVNDDHLPKMEMAKQHRPHVPLRQRDVNLPPSITPLYRQEFLRLMEVRSDGPQERDVDVLKVYPNLTLAIENNK